MKKVDNSKVAAGGMKHSSKKGVQKVDTNDNKDVNEEKILKERVRSYFSSFKRLYLLVGVCEQASDSLSTGTDTFCVFPHAFVFVIACLCINQN